MAFGMPDMTAVLAQITASADATERLAAAIDRLAAATERANEMQRASS